MTGNWWFPSLHVKYKCFIPAACADSSLQLSISAETIHTAVILASTLIKKKTKLYSYIRKFRVEQLQSHTWLTASSLWGNISAFPHILGSPSSYMTLQLLHSKFPYIWGKFDFLFYQCIRIQNMNPRSYPSLKLGKLPIRVAAPTFDLFVLYYRSPCTLLYSWEFPLQEKFGKRRWLQVYTYN
jgi:hypothetical protein